MGIATWRPSLADLDRVVDAVASWQREGQPVQLHSGDLGWQWRFGAEALADSLWVWVRDDVPVAVGFVDADVAPGEPVVARLALAPSSADDPDVVAAVAASLHDPGSGVLPADEACVEARFGDALRAALTARGWQPDEPWTPLRRDLSSPVEPCGLRIETVGPALVAARVAVQTAAFSGSTFSIERWRAMAAATPYRSARCLVGYDADGVAVAVATVWSAGPGRPGLLEPLGVHRDHRGRGHGRAISLAAATALREMGASSATVVTPAANRAAVATYRAAGYVADLDVVDQRRPS